MLKAKPGEIIRHKQTREPYLIIAKNAQGLLVVNLWRRTDPATVEIVLPRANGTFERDIDIVDMSKKEADILKEQMPLIEAIQKTLKEKN